MLSRVTFPVMQFDVKVSPCSFVIIQRMFQRITRILEIILILIALALLTSYSNPSLINEIEKVRTYTRQIEFNYLTWMGNAALIKLRSAAIGAPYAFNRASQKQLVAEYLRVTQTILEKEYLLELIYADADITDKEANSISVRDELTELYSRQDELAPLAEAVIQEQVSQVLAESGLTTIGQPLPNVWYHSTPLPMALIVSPRDRIEQIANISVNTNLTIDQQVALEKNVDKGLNTSSLVVDIGGVGVYPTMVMRATDLRWLLTVVAHEWTHNYLTLRPLGILYGETPELRTMNETTASIAGDEIGALVVKRFYPELIAASHPNPGLVFASLKNSQPESFAPPPFDFREEMHTTRVKVDELLADGKIEEAESYMENRRLVFLENGYLLRKINQAYFAFHGAYASSPGGAAGEDPVGPAVRALREKSESLADFVNTIAWMTNFEQLQKAVTSK